MESLEEVAKYLKTCRMRKLQTGECTFEPSTGVTDCSRAIVAFFCEHPEYRVTATSNLRFIGFSEPNLARLNVALEAIDPALQLTAGTQLGLVVDMSYKFGR